MPVKKPLPQGISIANAEIVRTAFSSTSGTTTGIELNTEMSLVETPSWWGEMSPYSETSINDDTGIGVRSTITVTTPTGCEDVSLNPWSQIINNSGSTQTNIQMAYKIRAFGLISGNFPTGGSSSATITMNSNTATGNKSGSGLILPELVYNDPKTFIITIATLADGADAIFTGSGELVVTAL
jgi:hypothetical protein